MNRASHPSTASRSPDAAHVFAERSEAQIARSRQRSIERYRLDPGSPETPRVLPAGALRERRVPMGPLLDVARSGMEALFQQVRDAGYVLLLTDPQGVAVDFITNPVLERELLRRSGLYLCGCWSEDEEGTCAVGLCAIDRRPITVHHGEHFRVVNGSLTCSAAPILAPDGRLLAVLDASALSSPDDKRSQHLVLQMVNNTARMIENAHFLREFERQYVLRITTRRELAEVATEGLIALDGGGTIIAANQRFLHDLGCKATPLVGLHIEEVFDTRFDEVAAASLPGAAPIALRLLHSGSQCFAVPRRPRSAAVKVGSKEHSAPQAARPGPASLYMLAGGDSQMSANAQRALRVLDKGVAVLLNGESGTGKEAFARAMHEASARAGAAFVALNCAAIPESLIESELFGYRDGAFTGAKARGSRGKIEQAHGGTLFLDEIGDMPLALQTRLLRVLAEREVMPLGAERPVAVDLQVICATHRDLMELVRDGQFRLDLYYRLNGLTFTLPALRNRQDIPELIESVLQEEAADLGRTVPHIAADAMRALLHHAWPGNIRELKNSLRAALALCDGEVVGIEHLPTAVVSAMHGGVQDTLPPPRLASLGIEATAGEGVPQAEPDECEALLGALRRHHWSVSKAARELQTCRATVYRRMQRFGIVVPNKREP